MKFVGRATLLFSVFLGAGAFAQTSEHLGDIEADRIVIRDPVSGASIILGAEMVADTEPGEAYRVFGIHLQDASGEIRITLGLDDGDALFGLFGDEGQNGFMAFSDENGTSGFMAGDLEGEDARLVVLADENSLVWMGQSRGEESRLQFLLTDERTRIRAFGGGSEASLEALVDPDDGAFLAMNNGGADGQVAIAGAMQTEHGPYTFFGASEGEMLEGSLVIGSDRSFTVGDGGLSSSDVLTGLGLAMDGICLLSRRC